jgi:hypothetical protein
MLQVVECLLSMHEPQVQSSVLQKIQDRHHSKGETQSSVITLDSVSGACGGQRQVSPLPPPTSGSQGCFLKQ